MDADNGFGALRDFAPHVFDRDVERARINIHKHRLRANVKQRQVGRGAGEQRHQHFVARFDPGEQIGQMQRVGSGTGRHAWAGLRKRALKPCLKQIDLRPLANPAAIERVAHVLFRLLRHVRVEQYNAFVRRHH